MANEDWAEGHHLSTRLGSNVDQVTIWPISNPPSLFSYLLSSLSSTTTPRRLYTNLVLCPFISMEIEYLGTNE